MENLDWSRRHGRRLVRVGAVLFLLGLVAGLGVPRFSLPRLGLSAHLLGIMQGLFLMVIGLLWPQLRLTRVASGFGGGLAVYGCVAAWVANVCGAIFRFGGSMVPMASGGVQGSAAQELAMRVLLRSSAVSLIGSVLLILWGLRQSAGPTD